MLAEIAGDLFSKLPMKLWFRINCPDPSLVSLNRPRGPRGRVAARRGRTRRGRSHGFPVALSVSRCLPAVFLHFLAGYVQKQ